MDNLLKIAPWLALVASIAIGTASHQILMDAREHLSGTNNQCRDAITVRAIRLRLEANPLKPESYDIYSAAAQNKEKE